MRGRSVQQFLYERGFSRAILVQLKRFPDGILVDGMPRRTIDRLTDATYLKVTLREQHSSESIVPCHKPLRILYEDEDLFVIDKPAGMPMHPSPGNHDNALANAVAAMYLAREEPFAFRPIGRLDKNTSGLVLLSKNGISACLLSAMLQRRTIRREYLAVCQGGLPSSGTISAPIGRSAGSVLLREVRDDGAPAVTHYDRLAVRKNLSLARIRLDTGRTHQIRVHMAYIGHPLPGDFLYNPDFSAIRRHALHSATLSFSHPITGMPLCFSSPLPHDMQALFYQNNTQIPSIP